VCGVVGLWNLDGRTVDREALVAARDSMQSRGPDDCGLHVDGSIGLAHRRLSIIDLSPAGRMPMPNSRGDIWGVFNGEIYNFAQLRKDLVALGHTFRSQTDSEVAINAYDEWGTDAFQRFDGMFALALYDSRNREIVLARDIMGEKPLFYCHQEGRVAAFASTLTAFLRLGVGTGSVDQHALRSYLEFGYVPAPDSLLHGVKKLRPGHFVVIRSSEPAVQVPYWRLEDVAGRRPKTYASLDDAARALKTELGAAVRSRLVADVPLGAFLSGGIDSSLVVALMREARASVRTFTIGFEDPRFDESVHAKRIADHLGVENVCLVLKPAQVLRELDGLVSALDEPMADYSMLPTMAVSRLARQHVTVALTGDGADELFAGYRYYSGTLAFEYLSAIPPPLREPASRLARLVPSARIRRAIERGSAADAASYFGRSGFYRGGAALAASRILNPSAARFAPDRVAEDVRAMTHLRATEAGMVWDATHTLPDAWLTKVDRASMAFGLETRAPFLKKEVVELAFSLPLRYRVGGTARKVVLRHLLAQYLPRRMFERPKQGFTAPLKTWFAHELRDELYDRLAPTRMARLSNIDPTAVRALLDEQATGKADHTQLLWALFLLDRWYERNIDAPLPVGAAS